MKYKVGDKVRIKNKEWYEDNCNRYGILECGDYEFFEPMNEYCGEVVTITRVDNCYRVNIDKGAFCWTDEMFEGLAKEENNACQKCVFAVYDDNPHCGLRGFRTSFNVERCSARNNTVPNGYELQEDGYFSWVEKKNDYPKTYKECCKVLGIEGKSLLINTDRITDYEIDLANRIGKFHKLIICRDAYWKIAGEEMGLGKPWSPSDNNKEPIHAITRYDGYIIQDESGGNDEVLEFPTSEMRDAFKKNFDPDIEFCKELL